MSDVAFCKVYPPIGIARLGDSKEDGGWFFGPESEDALPHKAEGFRFRDSVGAIKRQAVRFRIYAFNKDGQPLRELTADEAQITWSVSLANKKAAWFQFQGTALARDAFRGEASISQELPARNRDIGKIVRDEKTGRYSADPVRAGLLEIHATKSIEGIEISSTAGSAEQDFVLAGTFKKTTRVELGELRTDDKGRLIVLGGRGVSDAVDKDGKSIRASRWIRNYANNDDWYDDTSDGPVTVKVVLKKGGKEVPVDGAWVIVAPPDFAPDAKNLVTLYDVMEEVALANPTLPRVGVPVPRDPKRVVFDTDIAPVLQRMHGYRWVNARGLRGHGFRKPGDFQTPGTLGALAPELSDPSSNAGKRSRERIFGILRRPAYQRGPKDKDRYDDPAIIAQATGVFMPPLAGDEGDPVTGDPSTWLTLTYLQYERFATWAAGDFTKSADSVEPRDEPEKLMRALESLTRTPLDACAGGGFYPGMEMTAITREPSLYAEAFRLNHGILKAGDITKFMALPWQADFFECREHWWPAQRPDDVITDEDFELLLTQFTEEISGSYRQQFEQVLFNRVRWDRGIGPRSRPSFEYLMDRLLPDPGSRDYDAYLKTLASGGRDSFLRLYLSLTPVSSYEGLAEEEWPKGKIADRLPNPWRLQYLAQEALDSYSGRYFHLRVPSPEESNVAQDAKISADELRRTWSASGLSDPARVAQILGKYARSIRRALEVQIEKILSETPVPRKDASALRSVLQDASVASLELRNPQEFGPEDPAYKSLRASEMVAQATDRLYTIASNWAGDMDMVEGWRRMGFISERRVETKQDGEQVQVRAQVESERPRYDGRSYRDYFYYLMNIEKYQDFIGYARHLAEQVLASAQLLIDETGIFDSTHPESYIQYSKESFAAKLMEIYELLRRQASTALGWRTSRTHAETVRRILDTAPFNQTDGAWLRYIANAGPTDKVRSLLFEVWSDEVGTGDPALHHGNLFTVSLQTLGQHLPPISSRAYADNPDIDESSFVAAVFQLAISLHSEAFFPELLGMTLFLEWEVLSLVPGIKGREYQGIDAHFLRMHVGIDNATNGHGAKARLAVELYLDHVLKEGGEDAMQAEWRRIWRGFVGFATAGYDYLANKDSQDDLTINRRHPVSPEQRVADLMSRKAQFGSLNHLDNRLGAHRMNDLFERPDIFVEELAHSPWVVPGSPDDSRLINYLTSFRGPMYNVFDEADLALFREWILWLGREGDTRTPKHFIGKGEAMLTLLAELRELAQGASGHRRYRLLSGDKKVSSTIAELFEAGDLKALMRAIADPANGWVVPFNPGESALILDQARGGKPMGVALDRRFTSLANQIGRQVVIRWIEAGCPIPGEAPISKERVPQQPAWDGEVLFVQTLGLGAVH